MRIRILALCMCGMAVSAFAQENILQKIGDRAPGNGKVTIHQDERISALLGKPGTVVHADGSTLKMAGYRVQVYAGGNSRTAKVEAESISGKVKQSFPDLKVYTIFVPPRWLCRVGDFLSIEEADAAMRRLRKEGGFKEVTIVKEQVNVYL